MHLEARLKCPMCSHEFRACLGAAIFPNPEWFFKTCCPENGSWLRFSASKFECVEACSGGCLAFITESREPIPVALSGRKVHE